MKKLIIITILLSSIANITFTMDPNAVAGLLTLRTKALAGDKASKEAFTELNKGLQDPNYVVAKGSRTVLTAAGLIDNTYKVSGSFRAAWLEQAQK